MSTDANRKLLALPVVAAPATPTDPTAHACGCGSDHCGDTAGPTANAALDPGPGRRFRIPTMDCAVEESEIRRSLEPIAGIRALRFQLGARMLSIDAPAPVIDTALAAIRNAGFEPRALDVPGDAGDAAPTDAGAHAHAKFEGIPRLCAALAFAFTAEAIAYFGGGGLGWKAAGLVIAAIAIALAGFDTYQKGWLALRRARLNINALMTVAVTGAFVIGQWPEAAMVMALYAIAELIEARAVDRARNAISGLLALAPDSAEVRDAEAGWHTVPAADVALGALVRVKPGARVPLDGIVRAGSTSIDQAPVTGESIPVDKGVGDPVFAGTINQTGSFEFEVTAVAADSTLARIIHAVEQAQGSRAPMQRFVDRFAAVYTPGVFVIALAVALAGPWLFGWTALAAVYKALVLLVIACPCALVISTPVSIVSGLAAAARRGILIKGGVHLEAARQIKAIALDKTGTITEGKPRLVAWQRLGQEVDAAGAESLAHALAAHSDHPVARAIAAGLAARGSTPTGFRALTGRGVEAEVDGLTYVLGNHRLIEERGLCTPDIEAALRTHEAQGRTVSLLASTTEVLALFAVADTVKPTSAAAVAELKALGVTPVMLTGDNQITAQSIARLAGIVDVRGNLLPDDKLAAIRALRASHGRTAMTGDGINDAPALAQADLGIAMGGAGTDIAMDAADIVVMNDDLQRIAETVRLSRRTHRVLWQNIAIALGIKAVFLWLALFDDASMWMAVFADMGASLLVIFNGLRLLRQRAPR